EAEYAGRSTVSLMQCTTARRALIAQHFPECSAVTQDEELNQEADAAPDRSIGRRLASCPPPRDRGSGRRARIPTPAIQEMDKVKRTFVLFLATLLSLFTVSFGFVGTADAGAALDVVKSKQTTLFDLIQKPATPDNKKKISAMFDEMLDYGALAEASLG